MKSFVQVSNTLPTDSIEVDWQDCEKDRQVLGTLDFSLHRPSPGESFGGVCAWQYYIFPSYLSFIYILLLHPRIDEHSSILQHRLPYGYIANVCVEKSARKQGIASALLERAVQIGRDWGKFAFFILICTFIRIFYETYQCCDFFVHVSYHKYS